MTRLRLLLTRLKFWMHPWGCGSLHFLRVILYNKPVWEDIPREQALIQETDAGDQKV